MWANAARGCQKANGGPWKTGTISLGLCTNLIFPRKARLEQLAKSETPQVASLAAIVLEVARVTPYKRRRVNILARNHRDLLRRLGETGLVFAHTWDRLPPEVLAQMHLEETEVSVKEDKTKLLAPEISRTIALPAPEDSAT